MGTKSLLDSQTFRRNCSVTDAPPEGEEPMIEIRVEPQYAWELLLDNAGEQEDNQKTYRFKRTVPYIFRLRLRDILGTHFISPIAGEMQAVEPTQIRRLADTQGPYGRADDYDKITALVLEQIRASRQEIMAMVEVFDVPPHVHELMDFKTTRGKKSTKLVPAFPSIEVDRERRTFTVSKAELAAFPNHLIIYRCLREIQSLDGYTVLLTEADGVSVRYEDPRQIWPDDTFPDLSARDRLLRQ